MNRPPYRSLSSFHCARIEGISELHSLVNLAAPVGVTRHSWSAPVHSRLFAGSGRLLFLRLHGPRGHDAILPRIGDELAQVFVRVGNENVNNVPLVSLRAELWQQLCEIRV